MDSRKNKHITPGKRGAIIGGVIAIPLGYLLAVASKIPGNYSNAPNVKPQEAIAMIALCALVTSSLGYCVGRSTSYLGSLITNNLFRKPLPAAPKDEVSKKVMTCKKTA
jgi:hypothetical protein